MTDLYYLLGIFGGILLMLWCVFGNKTNHSSVVFADKPKRLDPCKTVSRTNVKENQS